MWLIAWLLAHYPADFVGEFPTLKRAIHEIKSNRNMEGVAMFRANYGYRYGTFFIFEEKANREYAEILRKHRNKVSINGS